jgi:phage terminase large subunit-like protein
LVNRALEVVPRKNAKSLKAAIASFYDLTCGGQLAPEIPVAAASSKQADDTVFGDMLKMVKNESDFVERYSVTWTNDEIRCGAGRIFKLTSLGERLDGLNPSLALFEEGHAGAASVYKVVKSAFGARPNALLRMITTAGYRPEGPGYELQLEAKRILEGTEEDYTFFAAIYTLDEQDYRHPETKAILWDELLNNESLLAAANPMYGISLDPRKIQSAMREAWRRPDMRNEAARTRFNLWTAAGGNLIDLAQWMACKKKGLKLEHFIGSDIRCWIGVDLATVLDMCAIVLLFELPGDMLAVFAKFYLPDQSPTYLDPEMMDQFDSWAADDRDEEILVLTEGPLADHDRVNADIDAFCEVFNVQAILCDPYQAHNTVKHLWDGNKPVMVYPNDAKTMTPPTDDLLGRIAAKTILHDGNPILAWNAQNTHGERRDNGSILPRKEKKGSKRKVDGIVALCMANGCRLNSEVAKPLVEETEPQSAYTGNRVIGLD